VTAFSHELAAILRARFPHDPLSIPHRVSAVTSQARAPSSGQQELPAQRAFCRFVDHHEPCQTLGLCCGLPGIGHRDALCAQSSTSRDSPASDGSPAARRCTNRTARRRPAPPYSGDDARRRPTTVVQAPQRLSPAPARVRPRPVVGGRQTAVPELPHEHRLEHALRRPAPLDRPRRAEVTRPLTSRQSEPPQRRSPLRGQEARRTSSRADADRAREFALTQRQPTGANNDAAVARLREAAKQIEHHGSRLR